MQSVEHSSQRCELRETADLLAVLDLLVIAGTFTAARAFTVDSQGIPR